MPASGADVAIAGFNTALGIPGSLLCWWGRPQRTILLALIAAVRAGLIGIWQVTLQAWTV